MESQQLVMAGKDLYNLDVFLHDKDICSVEFTPMRRWIGRYFSFIAVSGFRSVGRQQQIIERKLKNGVSMSAILAVNAAPGYSQHHTGCAIDLTDSDSCEKLPLEEDFESKPAFGWLMHHAQDHGFRLEYTRDNPCGVSGYEPWHWVFSEVPDYAFVVEKEENKAEHSA